MSFSTFSQSIQTIEAHQGELLLDHHRWVADECRKQGRYHHEQEMLWLVGIFHDIGKYTSIFQYYMTSNGIIHDTSDVQDLVDRYKQHALYGAFVFVWFVGQNSKYFLSQSINQEILVQYMIAGFYAILKHHGDLENIPDCQNVDWIRGKIAIIRKQSDYIQQDLLTQDYQILLDGQGYSFAFDQFLVFVKSPKCEHFLMQLFEKIDVNYSHLYKHFYASLIYADKYKTIFQDAGIISHSDTIPVNLIDQFKINKGYDKPTTALNIFRNEVYESVQESLKHISLDQHLYTLNSPTGSGKTYNLINTGLVLRDKLAQQGISAKIVYGLPFTSIIDQVFDELEYIVKEAGITTSQKLIKHHSLADNEFDNEQDEYVGTEGSRQKFFIEAWEGDIIVTTFFQIFHAFFGKENRRLIKFPNIHNTIFLLDEIQSTPYKYRSNFAEMFALLAKEYNCYFVLSSATLPLIFQPGQATELLPHYADFFAQMNRTRLDLALVKDKQKLTIAQGYEYIKQSLEKNPHKHHLITLNTIKSSVKMYRLIKQDRGSRDDTILIYLSTNIIPKERKERIQKIKKLTKLGEQRVIVVSTQMIEAGVDIDLDIGFRDLGPIDSIVQILGRLNRNGTKEQGILYLFQLLDEDAKREKSFWEYIYDPLVRSISDHILNQYDQIQEPEYKKLFDAYFVYLKEKQSKDDAKKITDARDHANFQTVHELFKLIESTQTVDLFVAIDEKAKELWEIKQQGRKQFTNKRDWKQERDKKHKKDFGQYVISVDAKKANKCGFDTKQLEFGLVLLDERLIALWYDEEIGFTVIDKNQDLLEDNFI